VAKHVRKGQNVLNPHDSIARRCLSSLVLGDLCGGYLHGGYLTIVENGVFSASGEFSQALAKECARKLVSVRAQGRKLCGKHPGAENRDLLSY